MIGQDDERRHNGEDTQNRALSIYTTLVLLEVEAGVES